MNATEADHGGSPEALARADSGARDDDPSHACARVVRSPLPSHARQAQGPGAQRRYNAQIMSGDVFGIPPPRAPDIPACDSGGVTHPCPTSCGAQ